MKRAAIFLLFCLLTAATAGDKPNFSGKWTLDKDRSFSNPPGLEQTINITHSGDKVTLEAKVKTTRGGEQAINESYTLDGKEAEFTPPAPLNAKGKRVASWLPNGKGFLVQDETFVDGKSISRLSRKWTMGPDAKSFTVDYFMDNPQNSFESKRVFSKVE
jgi:hypothetical protein